MLLRRVGDFHLQRLLSANLDLGSVRKQATNIFNWTVYATRITSTHKYRQNPQHVAFGRIISEDPQRWGRNDPVESNGDDTAEYPHFFDLPQEVRDLIYLRQPGVAWIDLTLAPGRVQQPTTSKVCRRMRKESLDVFYGRNTFMLDMRGWKHSEYPKTWTPKIIFERWLRTIGDHNVARLRSVSFYSHNFSVHIKVQSNRNHLMSKFRALSIDPQPVQNAPAGYTFNVAAKYAGAGFLDVLSRLQAAKQGRPLNADDFIRICSTVEMLQPFMCKRNNLGWLETILPSGNIDDWPDTSDHIDKCDDCGYHRITRGQD